MQRLAVVLLACSAFAGCGFGTHDPAPPAPPPLTPLDGPLTTGPDVLRECTTSVDDEDLPLLAFGIAEDFEIRAGSQHRFQVGVQRCCVTWDAIPACARWSIEEAPELSVGTAAPFVSIDPDSGLVRVASEAPQGTVFIVVAEVDEGRARVDAPVFVYGRPSPIAGCWREVARLDCDADKDTAIEGDGIAELSLSEGGEFGVSWQLMEAYVDYWGVYDAEDGAVDFTLTGGNVTPIGFQGNGSFELRDDDSTLVLRGVDLGRRETDSPDDLRDVDSPVRTCGHVFETSSTCLP